MCKAATICLWTEYQCAPTLCMYPVWIWEAVWGGCQPQPWHNHIILTPYIWNPVLGYPIITSPCDSHKLPSGSHLWLRLKNLFGCKLIRLLVSFHCLAVTLQCYNLNISISLVNVISFFVHFFLPFCVAVSFSFCILTIISSSFACGTKIWDQPPKTDQPPLKSPAHNIYSTQKSQKTPTPWTPPAAGFQWLHFIR